MSKIPADVLAAAEDLIPVLSKPDGKAMRGSMVFYAARAIMNERERGANAAEEVSVPAPVGMAGREREAFHQGADAMNEAIAAAIRAQGE